MEKRSADEMMKRVIRLKFGDLQRAWLSNDLDFATYEAGQHMHPFTVSEETSYEGKCYSHFLVQVVDEDFDPQTLFVLGGETKQREALEVAWLLSCAYHQGIQDAKREIRERLNLD
ncbi:hypothetical protein [Deinococcus fonticola]|uniref:hypothetical protein n=1 Tax=Deinococcus fonticola TaxID=2528713 RepID=UPI0010749F03|nr:hypothetical protein [Deinococcus fonticola]